jgi:hypothetical protein
LRFALLKESLSFNLITFPALILVLNQDRWGSRLICSQSKSIPLLITTTKMKFWLKYIGRKTSMYIHHLNMTRKVSDTRKVHTLEVCNSASTKN